MINEIRLENGLKALEWDPELYECPRQPFPLQRRQWLVLVLRLRILNGPPRFAGIA